jgi:hypothetical protein
MSRRLVLPPASTVSVFSPRSAASRIESGYWNRVGRRGQDPGKPVAPGGGKRAGTGGVDGGVVARGVGVIIGVWLRRWRRRERRVVAGLRREDDRR